jgi:putative ABC transport system substrate-binding protein
MKRREFITLLGGAAVWPIGARAQQPTMPVIGILSSREPVTDAHLLGVFRQGLKETGYIEGYNVAIEYLSTGGRSEPLPGLAADLVGRQAAVVVTMGDSVAGVRAVRSVSATTPIVFIIGPDPVKAGLVPSLNRPGGNMTGITAFQSELGAKKLELLRELAPGATTIAVLLNETTTGPEVEARDAQAAASALGRQVKILSAGSDSEIDAAFAILEQTQAKALLVPASPFFFTRARQIVALAARHAVPTLYFRREFVDLGGLVSYGTNTNDSYRSLGIYAGKVLKGANAGDLPVQLPTRFELVINLKTATALGLEVPPTLLARADEVIE